MFKEEINVFKSSLLVFSFQLTNKTLSSSSQSELENRLHQLTETLIQKQTMLESLSTEKNSLVYQLERMEQQLKAVQGNSANGPSINMAGMDSSEGKDGDMTTANALAAILAEKRRLKMA